MTTPLDITLKINEIPPNIGLFDFPCGESNCWNKATMELQLTTLDDDYRLPLCSKHAKSLMNARINSL